MISAVATSPRSPEIYSGLAAWSHHYWNLLALKTRTIELQQLVKNHNKPSAIIDDKGHIHYSNVAFNRIADENVGIAGHQWHFLFAE